jgi:transcription elongation GreA/GreB family factor
MTLEELKAERERVLARRNSLVSRVSVGDRSVQYDLAQADKVLADLERRIAQLEKRGLRRRILVYADKGL